MMTTLLQQGLQCQLNDSKDTWALMTAMKPLLQGQWHQPDDYASLTMAETPSLQRQQLPSQQWQRHLHINSNNVIMARATMPL
jgi:hypothetical protein